MGDTETAKIHIREHLITLIVPHVAEGFWSIHKAAVDSCTKTSQTDKVLFTFQNMLAGIPAWSDKTLSDEVARITKASNCTYLDDLLTGVFFSYMKSFASLHYRGKSKEIKINFDRPNVATFLHELYKHSARQMWEVAYLFKTAGITTEVQARNRQDIIRLISACMERTISSFIPWGEISKQYFVQDQDESESDDDSVVTEPEPEPEPQPEKKVSFGEIEPEIELGEEIAAITFEEPPAVIPDVIPDVPEEAVIQMEEGEPLVLNL